MKRRNIKKFIKIIIAISGIILFLNILIPDKIYSYKELEYKNIYVLSGDTLWSIAKEEKEFNDYYKGRDLRDIVQNIKSINNLSNTNLSVNQSLKIPIY